MAEGISLQVEVLESDRPVTAGAYLSDACDWAELSFFHTRRWCDAWSRHLAPGSKHTCLVAHEGGDVVGVLPLSFVKFRSSRVHRAFLPVVMTTGGVFGSADHLGVLARDDRVSRFLVNRAREVAGRLPLVLAAVRCGEDPSSSRQVLRACPRARIPEAASWAEVTAIWSKNRRKKIRQRGERFSELGGIFQWITDSSEVANILPVVFDLHTQRWDARNQSTQFGTSANRRDFMKDLALGQGEGSVWVQLALLDGEPVGALVGFDFNQVISVYQSGWSPATDRLGIGLLQYAMAYKHAVEARAKVFDMLRGASDYKMRFATEVATEADEVVGSTMSSRLIRRLFL